MAGSQNVVFGITNNSSVVCAGCNCAKGAYSNLQEKLTKFNDVVDICALGSECEKIILALVNGDVIDLYGKSLKVEHIGSYPVFAGDYLAVAVRQKDGSVKGISYTGLDDIKKLEDYEVGILGVGINDGYSFSVFTK